MCMEDWIIVVTLARDDYTVVVRVVMDTGQKIFMFVFINVLISKYVSRYEP